MSPHPSPSHAIRCFGCNEPFVTLVDCGTPLTKKAGDTLFHLPFHGIYDCQTCGLLFRCPYPSPSELANYYAKCDHSIWHHDELHPTESTVLDVWLSEHLQGENILDFGCSTGRLLAACGTRVNRFGFEINEEAATIATSRGIEMLSEKELWTKTGFFKTIFMVDVFEHLSDPTVLLKRLVELLMPGGRLIICTGNGDHWACRVAPAAFWYFRNYEHLCMLTRRYAEHFNKTHQCTINCWIKQSHYAVPPVAKARIWAAFGRDLARRSLVQWLSSTGSSNVAQPALPPTCNFSVSRDHVITAWRKHNS